MRSFWTAEVRSTLDVVCGVESDVNLKRACLLSDTAYTGVMTEAELIEAALKLDDKDKIALANRLYESASATPDWHRPIIEQRLESLRRDPNACLSGDEAIRQVFPEGK